MSKGATIFTLSLLTSLRLPAASHYTTFVANRPSNGRIAKPRAFTQRPPSFGLPPARHLRNRVLISSATDPSGCSGAGEEEHVIAFASKQPVVPPQDGRTQMPQVIGHRGAKGSAPENTLASVRAARSLGCTWVEMDVMLTKDKVPVIHHDNTLDRCTNGRGNLWDKTLEEIQSLDAGTHFSAAFSGEKIPRLTDLIACCRQNNLCLNLEVKHVAVDDKRRLHFGPTEEEILREKELAEAVCAVVEECNCHPCELVFSSFSREIIRVLRQRLPHFSCAFLVEGIPDDWCQFVDELQCVSLNFDQVNVTRAMVSGLLTTRPDLLLYRHASVATAKKTYPCHACLRRCLWPACVLPRDAHFRPTRAATRSTTLSALLNCLTGESLAYFRTFQETLKRHSGGGPMQRLATFLSPHLKQRPVRFGKRQLPVPPTVAEVLAIRPVWHGASGQGIAEWFMHPAYGPHHIFLRKGVKLPAFDSCLMRQIDDGQGKRV